MWITTKEFQKKYNITPQCFYNWKKARKIQTKEDIPGHVLVQVPDQDKKSIAIYTRVSTPKQKQDLDNQISYITKYCVSNGFNPEYIFSDIASGMNANRKSLNKLLDLVIQNKISKIFISHKDRLSRFSFEYIHNLCLKFNCEIEIINLETDKDFQQELTEDLIAIIHHFSMKFYGKRKNQLQDFEKSLDK